MQAEDPEYEQMHAAGPFGWEGDTWGLRAGGVRDPEVNEPCVGEEEEENKSGRPFAVPGVRHMGRGRAVMPHTL